MTDFLDINRGGAQVATESIGGGRTLLDSNVYKAVVKQAYLAAYDSGARYAAITLDIDGKEHEERLLLTNSKGEGYWTDRDGNPQQFAGLTRLDELAFAAGYPNTQASGIAPGNVRMWDKDAKSFVLKQHPTVLTGLRDKTVAVALQRVEQNKTKKNQNTNKYDKLNEKEEINVIQKFANLAGMTQLEAAKGINPPVFMEAWKTKWAGKTHSTYKEQPNAPTQGMPTASGGAAAAASDLFG